MTFIEGVGDEVTLFVVIFVAILLAAIVTLRNHTPGPQVHLVRARILGVSRVRITERGATGARSLESITRRLSNINNNNQITTETVNAVTETSSNDSERNPNNEFTNDVLPAQTLNDILSEQTLNNIPPEQTLNDVLPEQTSNDRNPQSANMPSSSADAMPNDAESNNEETIIVDDASVEARLESTNDVSSSKVQDQATSNNDEASGNNETAPGEIRVRLKYLDDTERIVTTTPSTTIGDFKKKHFQEEIRSNKIVRLIYAGRLLQNTFTIEFCRIVDNSVVHVQVLAAPAQQSTPTVRQEEFDVGRFLWPIITVILGLCWMTYFKFPEFYNSLSLGMLFVFSGCFCYFISRSYE